MLLLCLACKKNRKNQDAPGPFAGTYTGVYYKETDNGATANTQVKVTFSGNKFQVDASNNPPQLAITFTPSLPGQFSTRGADSIFMEGFSSVSSLSVHSFKYAQQGDSLILQGWRGNNIYEYLRLKK
ncbi:hypothetical protein DLD77_10010 [Chitinophaga alhagiae]|uniref:Uncharacterized protein n=1 Tax=Chitinophaga alhagiae TaxID=2203219 RepID=A0ABM6WDD3_9BACT|nr:hypothetical protein DLD77_10010 [Chitinophaga alhagiae]